MKMPIRHNSLAALIRLGLLSMFAAASASATTYTVTSTSDSASGTGTSGSLRYTLGLANSGDTVSFNCAALGCPVTIDATSLGNNGGFPGPTAYSIGGGKSITLTAPNTGDVTLVAHPGTTSATSMRLFFIDTGAALNLQNVTLSSGRAIGGNGGSSFKGTGGGAAGLGGAIFSQGTLTLTGVSFVGNGATGGNSTALYVFGDNLGGGGGLGGDGGGGCSGGGGGTGGNGGVCTFTGQPRGNGGVGGAGLGGSGGGSPGGYNFGNGFNYQPGSASLGGGGGGGYSGNGPAGSEGGGGGSSGAAHLPGGSGGAGGFGGGGGGNLGYHNYEGCNDAPGPGGFGGGAGAGCRLSHGGVGGGDTGFYSTSSGAASGAGAAFGGALFARAGAVTIHTSGTGGLAGNSLAPGSGAHNGAAAGRGLFLMSGVPTTLDVSGTYTVTDDIADDSAIAVPPGQNFGPGNGAGANVTKTGTGALVLDADNTYAGTTTISAGTLAGSGGVAGPVTLASGAAIAPGDPGTVGVFSTGALTWSSGGVMNFDLGANSAQSDRLVVNGALGKNGSGAYNFHFGVGHSAPVVGQIYTLIQATSVSGFAPGDFSFDTDAAYQGLSGTFSIAGNAVLFTVNSVASDLVFADGYE